VTGPEGGDSGIQGVRVCFSGGYGCVETDGSGDHRMEGLLAGETYTVTPSKSGLRFIPTNKQITLNNDVEEVNFVGVPEDITYSVSGFVTGPAGPSEPIAEVDVCFGNHGCVKTDNTGNYRKEGFTARNAHDHTQQERLQVQPSR